MSFNSFDDDDEQASSYCCEKEDHPLQQYSSSRSFIHPSFAYMRQPPSSHHQDLSMGMTTDEPFKVIIAGGNIAGLTLGCFLQLAGIDYVILESRLTDNLPRGTIVLGSFVMNLLAQLDLVHQTNAASYPMTRMTFWRASASECEDKGHIDFSEAESRFAYNGCSIEYADLQAILLSKIPPSRIIDGQRVVQFTQDRDQEQITVRCSDGSFHTGSILVGADGYNSTVRQLLYEELVRQPPNPDDTASPPEFPPPSDLEPLGTNCCISGSTDVLDPQEGLFPELYQKDGKTLESNVISGAEVPFCWWMTYRPQTGKVKWLITYDRRRDTTSWQGAHPTRDDIHRPDIVQDFFDQMRPLRTPFGGTGTLGDLIDRTDPNSIQLFNRCHKMYQTWYHKRVVLIGDACHKLVPFAGQGALQAMLDACQLSKAIKGIQDSVEPLAVAIESAFHDYQSERYTYAFTAVEYSRGFSDLVGNSDFDPNLLSGAQFDVIPDWLHRLSLANAALNSHQEL